MTTPPADGRTRLIDHLQVVVATALALYLLFGIVAWTWMIINGVAVPGAFATVLATIAGGLLGQLTALRNQRTAGTSIDDEVATDLADRVKHDGDGQAPAVRRVVARPTVNTTR